MHLVCARCGQVNRVAEARLSEAPKCGACHTQLLPGEPAILTGERFDAFVARNELPVVVDFWAEWCGPCKMFAPIFAQAADQYRLRLRLAKLDTEAYPEIAQRLSIRSIPTMIAFKQGSEAERVSGALDAGRLRSWLERQTA